MMKSILKYQNDSSELSPYGSKIIVQNQVPLLNYPEGGLSGCFSAFLVLGINMQLSFLYEYASKFVVIFL